MTAAEGTHPNVGENIEKALAFLKKVPAGVEIIACEIPENIIKTSTNSIPYQFTFHDRGDIGLAAYEFSPQYYPAKANPNNFDGSELRNYYTWLDSQGICRGSLSAEPLINSSPVQPTPSFIVATELLRLADEVEKNL